MAKNLTVTESTHTVAVSEPDSVVIKTEDVTHVVAAAPVALTVNTTVDQYAEIVAGSSLSALRVIATGGAGTAIYADHGVPQTAQTVVGVSVTAVGVNVPVRIQVSGDLDDAGWSWTPGGKLYVGTGGSLTQTPPTTGYLKPIGHAVTATKIVIDLGDTVILS